MKKYKIKVTSVHWMQIRMLMKLGYHFIEKNKEKSYYIVETDQCELEVKKLEECNWVENVKEYKDIESKKIETDLSFEKIIVETI